MTILLLLVASIFLYGKSKYFPKPWQKYTRWLRNNKVLSRGIAYLLLSAAALLFILKWGGFTGMVIWFFTFSMIISLVLIGLPLSQRLSSH